LPFTPFGETLSAFICDLRYAAIIQQIDLFPLKTTWSARLAVL